MSAAQQLQRLLDAAMTIHPSVVANWSDLARFLGESEQSITNWKTRGIPKGKLMDIARLVGCGADWLRSGSGDMRNDSPVITRGAVLANDGYSIPVMDALASAGLGQPQASSDTVIGNIQLTKSWVDGHLGSITSPKNLAVLSAYGDSMSPTFSDGDLLLVDRGIDAIKLDAVYVLALNNELYVKRIQRRITDGAVVIKSDNPLYDPVTVTNGERDALSVLGRVVWAWNGRKL